MIDDEGELYEEIARALNFPEDVPEPMRRLLVDALNSVRKLDADQLNGLIHEWINMGVAKDASFATLFKYFIGALLWVGLSARTLRGITPAFKAQRTKIRELSTELIREKEFRKILLDYLRGV